MFLVDIGGDPDICDPFLQIFFLFFFIIIIFFFFSFCSSMIRKKERYINACLGQSNP
jgi:hypothetical protein